MFCPFSRVICLSLPDVPVAPLALWAASEPEFPYRQRPRIIILCANSCLVMLEVKIVMMGNVSSRILHLIWRHLDGLCGTGLWFAQWKICLVGIVRWGYTTKYHRLSGLNRRNLFCHSSGGQKSEIKVLAGLVSSEASLLSLQMAVFSLCPHKVFPLWCSCHNFFFLSGYQSYQIRVCPNGFILIYLCEDPISPNSDILRFWGVGLQHVDWGDTIPLSGENFFGSEHPFT